MCVVCGVCVLLASDSKGLNLKEGTGWWFTLGSASFGSLVAFAEKNRKTILVCLCCVCVCVSPSLSLSLSLYLSHTLSLRVFEDVCPSEWQSSLIRLKDRGLGVRERERERERESVLGMLSVMRRSLLQTEEKYDPSQNMIPPLTFCPKYERRGEREKNGERRDVFFL